MELDRFAHQAFTKRERTVVDCIRHGMSVKEISVALQLSEHTLKTYIKAIYTKARVHSSLELVAHLAYLDALATPAQLNLFQAVDLIAMAQSAEAVLTASRTALTVLTNARHVSCWTVRDGKAAAVPAEEKRLDPDSAIRLAFLVREISVAGVCHSSTSDFRFSDLHRILGISGEVIGMKIGLMGSTEEPVALLAATPQQHRFVPDDLRALRLVAALAQSWFSRSLAGVV